MKEIFELQPLFEDVQMQQVFADGKTFVDCIPQSPVDEILQQYLDQKDEPGFDLKAFVLSHFDLPFVPVTKFSGENKDVVQHIESLWQVLTRQPDTENGSLIPLPFSYIVPGGRFGEIYYWDSYFSMLGLRASGRIDMIGNMIGNFSYLVDTVGYIPNGNRRYFIGRSQPPFYSLMIKLLSEEEGKTVLTKHLPQLQKEYDFWMKGSGELTGNTSMHHVVRMKDGELLNRFWDENDTPRPESFRDDVELSYSSHQLPGILFRHLRAAAESGWDFSSRWFSDVNSFTSIHTTDIIPVDLNCLLLHLEEVLSEAYELSGNRELSQQYLSASLHRKEAIEKYCWNEEAGFYFDYDLLTGMQNKFYSAAGAFPLFFKVASKTQAEKVKTNLCEKLLCEGGIVTTTFNTGQQWDHPNGWAPLQWITIAGLENYDYQNEAKEIAARWIKLNKDVFVRTGKLMEKYNVVDTHLEAGGGEYAGQDGFGWTNGVLLALIKKYGDGG